MKRPLNALLSILLAVNLCLGQTAFMQLTPGKSSRTDATQALGQPVTKVSETLFEYRPRETGQKLYIQYRSESELIDRVEVVFENAMQRTALASLIGLGPKADATKWDTKGRLEEYFGTTRMVVLTHEGPDVASPFIRMGYYSTDLFALAMQKPTGTPMPPQAPKLSTTPAKASTAKSPIKIFDKVDLLVPKGDKAKEKSARLIFDGNNLVIDGDKGETIYKTFPYASIVSADYSYSTKPRWKAALGAALLIGVFALPILFMKSKQHWLTIKTANDFAILRLDKDNYKIILPTFETSTGKKVETVAEEK